MSGTRHESTRTNHKSALVLAFHGEKHKESALPEINQSWEVRTPDHVLLAVNILLKGNWKLKLMLAHRILLSSSLTPYLGMTH